MTADLGFAATVALRRLTLPAIVQLRTDSTDPKEVGPFVLRSVEKAERELASGEILTIERHHARLRRGPDPSTSTDET